MTLKEIIAHRRRATAEGFEKAQEKTTQDKPAVIIRTPFVCQELESYLSLFEGCVDY